MFVLLLTSQHKLTPSLGVTIVMQRRKEEGSDACCALQRAFASPFPSDCMLHEANNGWVSSQFNTGHYALGGLDQLQKLVERGH